MLCTQSAFEISQIRESHTWPRAIRVQARIPATVVEVCPWWNDACQYNHTSSRPRREGVQVMSESLFAMYVKFNGMSMIGYAFAGSVVAPRWPTPTCLPVTRSEMVASILDIWMGR